MVTIRRIKSPIDHYRISLYFILKMGVYLDVYFKKSGFSIIMEPKRLPYQ